MVNLLHNISVHEWIQGGGAVMCFHVRLCVCVCVRAHE